MKLSTNTNNYRTNIAKAADFGIQDNDLSHIMGILRSQIYSDKLLAVIREYSTNAVDANVEAGNPAPINVHLPTVAARQSCRDRHQCRRPRRDGHGRGGRYGPVDPRV